MLEALTTLLGRFAVERGFFCNECYRNDWQIARAPGKFPHLMITLTDQHALDMVLWTKQSPPPGHKIGDRVNLRLAESCISLGDPKLLDEINRMLDLLESATRNDPKVSYKESKCLNPDPE